MKPIEDQIFLVTGATDGIGKAVAHKLACMGTIVLLHGRSQKKAEAVREEIRQGCVKDRLRCYLANFASLLVAGKKND